MLDESLWTETAFGCKVRSLQLIEVVGAESETDPLISGTKLLDTSIAGALLRHIT